MYLLLKGEVTFYKRPEALYDKSDKLVKFQDIGNILNFKEDFPEARITKLEQNYRSTSNILGVAGSVIRKNHDRMDKTLWTENPPGEKVTLMELDDEVAEASWVGRHIRGDETFRPGETAVFYRTNAQSRVIEDVNSVERVLIDGTEQGTVALLSIFGVLAILFCTNPLLAAIALALPVVAILTV